jgi:hypothetical protein
MTLALNPTSAIAHPLPAPEDRTAPHAALDTAPSPALTRQREAEALVRQARERDHQVRELYTRAIATDINLRLAWEDVAERWPTPATPDYVKRVQDLVLKEWAAREKAKREKQGVENWGRREISLLAALVGVPLLVGLVIGIAIGVRVL